MSFDNLPYVLIIKICNFLNTYDINSLSQTCKFIRNNIKTIKIEEIKHSNEKKTFHLNISNIKISMPNSTKILTIKNCAQLSMINMPPKLDTIIIENLNYNGEDLNLLNVKNLYIKKITSPEIKIGQIIDLSNLDKIKNLHIPDVITTIFLPDYIKKIYCKKFYVRKKLNLKYLECTDLFIDQKTYIKTLKINSEFGTYFIRKCDKLILKKNHNLDLNFTDEKPMIEYCD